MVGRSWLWLVKMNFSSYIAITLPIALDLSTDYGDEFELTAAAKAL